MTTLLEAFIIAIVLGFVAWMFWQIIGGWLFEKLVGFSEYRDVT